MKILSKVLIATMLSTSALAGVAHAESVSQEQPQTTAGDGQANSLTKSFGVMTKMEADPSMSYSSEGDVNIIYKKDMSKEAMQRIDNTPVDDPEVIALQSSIRQDATLVAALEAQNVNVDMVVGSYMTADGQTVYVVR